MKNITMKLTKYFCLICAYLFLGFSTINCRAGQFNLPDSLFNVGEFKTSSVEYEYIYYSSSDNLIKTRALLGKSACLKKMGLFSESSKCLERVSFDGLSDTATYSVLYQTALCSFLAKDFGYAESQIVQMRIYISDSTLIYPSLPLHVMILNEQKKWKEAEKVFESYLVNKNNSNNDSLINTVRLQYKKTPRLKNVKKAMRLSSFLPGAGQMYLGYWGDGLINASLQLGSVAFIGYNVFVAQYFTAITLGTGLLQKFYVGGIHRVEYLGNKKNYERTRKFNDSIKKSIVAIAAN